MFRKVLITAIVATAVFAAGSAVYAQEETENTKYIRDDAPIFVMLSDKEESKTFEREYIISARSKEGTEVVMEVYWFKAEDEKSILAKKKSVDSSDKEGTWILQETDEYTVGNANIFAVTTSLNLGKNRIVLNITDKNGNVTEKTLEIERFLEREAWEEVSGNSVNEMENWANGTNKQ
jgi:hypothetical protein